MGSHVYDTAYLIGLEAIHLAAKISDIVGLYAKTDPEGGQLLCYVREIQPLEQLKASRLDFHGVVGATQNLAFPGHEACNPDVSKVQYVCDRLVFF